MKPDSVILPWSIKSLTHISARFKNHYFSMEIKDDNTIDLLIESKDSIVCKGIFNSISEARVFCEEYSKKLVSNLRRRKKS